MAKSNKEPLNEEDKKRKLNKDGFQKLIGVFQFMLPYKGTFIFGVICLFFSSTLFLAFPELIGKLIDVAQGKKIDFVVNGQNEIVFMLIGILLLQSIFSFFRIYLFALVAEPAMADIRQSLYRKFMTLPMAFYDKKRTGELVSRITSDVSLLQNTFTVSLSELFRQVLVLVVGIGLLFWKTWELTIFMLLTFPVLIIIIIIFGKYIRTLSKKTQDALAKTNIVVEETLQALPMVKAFTNEFFEAKRYKTQMNETVKLAITTAKYRGLFVSTLIFGLFLGIVLVIWYGTTLVSDGSITVGTLLSFVLYTMFIGGSVAGLGDVYGNIQRAIGASELVLDILDEESEQADQSEIQKNNQVKGNNITTPIQGEIRINNLQFSYPTRSDIQVLKGVNMEIPAGNKVAIVGQSGAGKSTIVQLLLRFYNFQGGEITVDGKGIESYELSHFRNHIAIVPQEVILFGGTIRENIGYGKTDATDAEIKDAAEQANAWQFIQSFPEGLDTLVGERGVKLSGGQRQRVAIARAILKNPKILLLDEATSSLDAESELLVQQALDKLMEGRTSVIIAHRLATIRKADTIYVLDEGKIAESGTHEKLVQQENGIYANLIKLQFDLSENTTN
jgi:ABC-type multidrug transport system fused ATPase/permease subunit